MKLRRIIPLLFCLAGLIVPAQPQQQQQQQPEQQKKAEDEQEVISVETNQVVLNVTVTDAAEKYVSGLKRTDFRVFEDKQPQRIVGFKFEEIPFAAAILLDASGSMEQKMTLVRSACGSFVEGIREADTFAIYSFTGTKVKQLQPFSEVRDVGDFIWDLRADGMTPMYDAVVKASEDLAQRPEKRRAILLVSDGVDSTSRASLDQAIRKASAASVMIYCVDLSDRGVFKTTPRDNGADIMKTLAVRTGGRFFSSPAGRQLKDAFTQAVDELRNQYTITYEPTNEKKDGKWRTVEVSLTKPALSVRTRQGYYAPKEKK